MSEEPAPEPTWAVICRGKHPRDGGAGGLELATHQIFARQSDAREYAASNIAPGHRAVVVFGDWRDARARAHLPSSCVAVTFIEPPTDTSVGTGRLLPLDTTRTLRTVCGRFSQLRLPGDGVLPGEPLPPLDADPSIWTI